MIHFVLRLLLAFLIITNSNAQIFANDKITPLVPDDISYNYTNNNNIYCTTVYDPYEHINRKIFIFNGILDAFILRPIAKGYEKFTNDYTKNRVETFVDNLRVPLTTINYGLQGNSTNTLKSFWRFMVNSTIGIGGLFDVASKLDLSPTPQTFGNTLAVYGVGQGPYIVLPIFGGTSSRDLTDQLFTDKALNITSWYLNNNFKTGVAVTRMIHYRQKILPFTDYVSKNSLDPYIAIRDSLMQRRESKMLYPAGFKCPKVN